MKYLNFFIFVLFLSQLNLYGNPIHRNLDLELFKNDTTKINGILKFEKVKNKYNIVFEIPKTNSTILLDTLNIKKEVKSVFLYDINLDGAKEIFVIYSQNGKYSLEGYSLSNLYIDDGDYYKEEILDSFKTLNIATSQRLNKKIENIPSFNANLAKKELEKLTPYYKVVNLNSYDIWDVLKRVGEDNYYSKGYLYQYELAPQDYEKFNLQKYFKIYSIDNLNFIKNIGGNVLLSNGKYYFLFQVHHLGLITLEEVFQGEIINETIIKNGEYFNSFENGFYEKNIKIGPWNSYKYSKELERYIPIKKYFSNGVFTRKDIFYRKLDELSIFSSTFYDSKNEIEKIIYYEPNGAISQIQTYNGPVLEKVINYTHYKRNYSIYDKIINPTTGYEYYKSRESLTLFKDLNILDAKLENDELNLYSIKDSNGKDIFIKFQNYSPKTSFQEGIRWYEDSFKYFGIKEIFYGKRKFEKISSLEDIVKDGYFEEFSLGSFPGGHSITGSYRNIETVIKSGCFENGIENGVWKTYDPSRGDLLSSLTYVNGVLQGPYNLYDSDLLKENGEYKDGVKVIFWKAPPMFLFSS
ncbi:MAG: hypothetical protein RR682_09160 [Cetobacterium sp.]|uniref:hypothetical protein n=1 Tax=Cetobacterium sp. TaxID=2071632 RepID=UPI002FC62548